MGGEYMKFIKGAIMIFMWYAYVMLAGTSIWSKDPIATVIAPLWLAVTLLMFPVFKKKTEEINE